VSLPGSGVLTTVASGQPIVNQASNNYLWAQMVLVDAGLPTTQNNLNNVASWMTMEEPASDWWHNNNPLNINASGSGSDTFPSLTIAAQTTAQTLRSPLYANNIYKALASNASPSAFLAALQSSPWASSHYPQYTQLPGAPATVAVGGSGTTGTGATSAPNSQQPTTSAPGSCGSKGGGISFLGASIGNACQLKALAGGALIGIGGGILLVGAVLIASYGLKNTRVGAAVGKVGGNRQISWGVGAVTDVGRTRRTQQDIDDEYAESQIPTESYASRQARYKSEGFGHGVKEMPTPSGGRSTRSKVT
jgi:hypothetical protein